MTFVILLTFDSIPVGARRAPSVRVVELFAAGGEGGLTKDLTVTELREELDAREEPVSGNKAWLRRRLHAAIVRDHLEACADEGI